MMNNARRKTKVDKALGLVLLLAFAVRLYHLDLLPVFHDEALYLYWAKQTVDKFDLTIALKEISTLQVWIIALFYKLSPSILWLGRFLTAITGVLTVAVCYGIGWQLYRDKSVAQLAAFIYAIIPYAVFHD